MVEGLFDLNEGKRESVDENGEVRSELVLSLGVFAGEFRGGVPLVVFRMLEVNEVVRSSKKLFVKLLTQVIVGTNADEFIQHLLRFDIRDAVVQVFQGAEENALQNVGIVVIVGFTYMAQVFIPKAI